METPKYVYIVTKDYDTYKGTGSDVELVTLDEKKAKKLAKEIFENIKPDYYDEPMGEVEVYEDEDNDYFAIHDNDCSHSVGVICYELE